MRFVSTKQDGFQVFAVTGTNTVSFGIDASKTARKNLLGFAVNRQAHNGKRETMRGFKVFASTAPKPDEDTWVSSNDHPIQSLVWDDFTLLPGTTYTFWFCPLRGTPKDLDRSANPIKIRVKTEALYSTQTHDVFFNRGVASSQAYVRQFGTEKIEDLKPAKKAQALRWLSRDLDDAMLRFVASANKNDSLRCCFYECHYAPMLEALAQAAKRGVKVELIFDAKDNAHTDPKTGALLEAFPKEENLRALKKAKFPASQQIARSANKSYIQHNKFMVLLRGTRQTPSEVWTGSTNLSDGGIHGQTNVGHWVKDNGVAKQYNDCWMLLASDPTAAQLKPKLEALSPIATTPKNIGRGTAAVFSPRANLKALDLYVALLDSASTSAHITLAFGINKKFKAALQDNTAQDALTFLLLEKEDKPNSKQPDAFVRLSAQHNIYQAWGAYLHNPVYQWAKETNARMLQLNNHVAYMHCKFLLRDPLGKDPIVVTGSANFSEAATSNNDENMLVIRGDLRAADIYFTEFNRLFNHYYFRSVVEATSKKRNGRTSSSLFLSEDDSWLQKYAPGSLRQKRLALFTRMFVPNNP